MEEDELRETSSPLTDNRMVTPTLFFNPLRPNGGNAIDVSDETREEGELKRLEKKRGARRE